MDPLLSYKLVGQTRDDAVGEAFDKVARMLGLPYPGGPQVSKLAEAAREAKETPSVSLPRPMIDSNTCDFSFAGLKTAVLYLLKDMPELSDEKKRHVAHEFENAVADVLWKKTARALSETGAKTLVIGGGVSANTHIRRIFEEKIAQHPDVSLRIPAAALTTDNAIMIALAAFYRALRDDYADAEALKANGTRSLAA
jgi:N6-L-threonylcarbamoyladenine synthase